MCNTLLNQEREIKKIHISPYVEKTYKERFEIYKQIEELSFSN